MGNLFHVVLYQPLFNLLVFFYNLIPDIGVSIIIITLIVKIILFPLSRKAAKSQRALQLIQPKIEALKEKYKDQKEVLAKETMLLYKNEKINPFASCLPLLIQFPIIIAVYRVFMSGLKVNDFQALYGFVSSPTVINTTMFGISWLDLSKPLIFLGVLAGVAQFWQSRILMSKTRLHKINDSKKEPGIPEMMNKQMMYMMPIITIVISASLPGGLALYWLVMTLFSVFEQYIANKSLDRKNSNIVPEVIDIK